MTYLGNWKIIENGQNVLCNLYEAEIGKYLPEMKLDFEPYWITQCQNYIGLLL